MWSAAELGDPPADRLSTHHTTSDTIDRIPGGARRTRARFAASGKTTVFNAMTGLHAPVGYGGEIRIGTVRVPDARIDALSKIFSPKKTTYAEISFSDVPGEHGAEKKGLSMKALQQIREQDALCLVLRDFPNPAVEGDADPLNDLEAFHLECAVADLGLVPEQEQREEDRFCG